MCGACFLRKHGHVRTSVSTLQSDEQDSKFFVLPNPAIMAKSCLHPVTASVAFADQEAVRKTRGVKPCERGNCSGQGGAAKQRNR